MSVLQNFEPTPEDSRRKRWLLLVGVVLVCISFLGGFIGAYMFMTQNTIRTVNAIEKQQNQQQDPFNDSRNTYVVQAVEKVAPAIVGITTKVYARDLNNRNVVIGEGIGSGIIFDSRGYIATNYHVVANAPNNTLTVTLSDGKAIPGTVVGVDPQSDLAVVKIQPFADMKIAALGDSASLHVGEPAIAIGNPLDLELQGSVSVGIISALHRTIDSQGQRIPLIQTDAAINPGNSGGALIDANGFVIGINSAKIVKRGIEGLGFAIPINQAKPILNSLIERGKVVRPYLGISLVDQKVAAQYGEPYDTPGCLIVQIDPNGPAARAGLRPGDIITKINAVATVNFNYFRETIDSYAPGEAITLTYVSHGNTYTANLTVDTMPNP